MFWRCKQLLQNFSDNATCRPTQNFSYPSFSCYLFYNFCFVDYSLLKLLKTYWFFGTTIYMIDYRLYRAS